MSMIDWARVNELVEEIGAEDFGDVVELFLDEVDSAIGLLDKAHGNPVVVEEQMHFLKGAALNLGFEALAQLCMKGEKSAAGGRPEVVSAAEVRRAFEASKEAFERDLPNRSAA
jgi:HPt (histidine-containing phosphotransfer) domain-containing protein